jgi:hypothetical protein
MKYTPWSMTMVRGLLDMVKIRIQKSNCNYCNIGLSAFASTHLIT